ncbi:hypothetical protein [Thiolinea disciformis]|uniref:hypothetical protein n=1 Tax=Thiolinea disciformis TaxID=125614 RepID=UPI0003626209|nr:hypothetical protein [Thiolinea disciformis]
MIRSTLLIVSTLLTLSYSITVQAVEKPNVDLILTEHIDEACQGTVKKAKTAAPKDCIQYRVTITNHGTSTIQHLRINTKIPEHTVLEQMPENALWRIEGQNLRLVLNELPAGEDNSISFNYRVKVL